MKILKSSNILLGILLVHLILITFIHNNLYPIHFVSQNIFFLDLVGIKANISYGLLVFFEAANLFLLWLVSKRIFAGNFSLIPPIIYAISPWNSYLTAAGSFYIYLLFPVLLAFYGLVKIEKNQKIGRILLLAGTVAAFYSSLLLFFILPVILSFLIIFRLVSFRNIKSALILLIILVLPLVFLIYQNRSGFINILSNEIKIFSDPGLQNTINSYQGAAQKVGLGKLAKISENKYLFFTEYIFLKYTKQLIVPTYFTSQEKLLNFSFSSPIYLGFLIPFFLGLYQMLKSSNLRKVILLSTLLVIPSMLSKSMVDLNRLALFIPAIILVTASGLILLLEQRKRKIGNIFLAITICLVVSQFLVTLSDIQTREKNRYVKYYGQNYEMSKQ